MFQADLEAGARPLAETGDGPGRDASPGLFLIAGSGSIGRRHLENLRRLGHDAFFFRSGRRDPGAPPPEAREEFELERALASGLRAVLVCNPSALHLPVATSAARAGCHLL